MPGLEGGVPGPGGRGCGIPAALRQTPSPVNRITDTCENITYVAGGKKKEWEI